MASHEYHISCRSYLDRPSVCVYTLLLLLQIDPTRRDLCGPSVVSISSCSLYPTLRLRWPIYQLTVRVLSTEVNVADDTQTGIDNKLHLMGTNCLAPKTKKNQMTQTDNNTVWDSLHLHDLLTYLTSEHCISEGYHCLFYNFRSSLWVWSRL